MSASRRYATPSLGILLTVSCGAETLPADVTDYETRCQQMNARPIRRYEGDPHGGTKNVYACNVDEAFLRANTRPFLDGAILVKTSTKENATYPWLVATARKQGGSWQWDEYTRNFDDEDFVRIAAPATVCTDCHRSIERADWIFTPFTRP